MGFSVEWEEAYKAETNLSIWPWSELISMFYHSFPKATTDYKKMKVLELGCGAGANIPFFVSIGAEYYSVEGSKTEVNMLKEKYKQNRVTIAEGDFTEGIPFSDKFDLIFDRAAVAHNSSSDIVKICDYIHESLKESGWYFGINWFATDEPDYRDLSGVTKKIDNRTYQFMEGIYGKLGNVHFTDEGEIKNLFSRFEIMDLYESREEHHLPEKWTRSMWSFSARKLQAR